LPYPAYFQNFKTKKQHHPTKAKVLTAVGVNALPYFIRDYKWLFVPPIPTVQEKKNKFLNNTADNTLG
jgi:hypothetical protein